jgi:2,4-dienoyl-CoA reductase-like NADH-dependent reductase (Old Yellow Enzyme family)
MSDTATLSAPSQRLTRVWEPLTIRNVTLRNRIMQPAHSSQMGDPATHFFSKRHFAHFRERAKGEVALSITETVAADRSAFGSFKHIVNAWDPACIPSMTQLAEAVHEHGGRIMVQLAAMGVHDQGRMFMENWRPIWGASRIPSNVHNEIPLVMGRQEIRSLQKGFGQTALHCKTAGLDGVELHGAHSYGLAQFLSSTYNKRTDEYGGSPADRCRMVIEVAEEVRGRVGEDFVVGVRLSWDEFLGPGGNTPEDSEEQIAVLADTGLFDFFNISAGGYHTIHLALPSMEGTEPDAWLAPFSKRAKEIVGDRAKVFVVGKITDLHTAEGILASGAADMVAMARQLLADPFIVKKTREGREHHITRCNHNNECAGRLWENREVVCALNPTNGREEVWGDGMLNEVAPENAKRVLVVGAGPAGMKAAAVAGRRGHDVVLVDGADAVGGHLRLLERLPGLAGWNVAIDNLVREMERGNVEVRLGERAELDTLRSLAPDVVIVATGATHEGTGLSGYRPERLSIPGADLDHVVDVGTAAERVLEDPRGLGERVMIVDETGGHLPLAVAEVLADAGVQVEFLTPRMFVGEGTFRNLDILYILPRLRAKTPPVVLTAQHFVDEIRPGEVTVYDLWSGPAAAVTREVDAVVLSMLRIPRDHLYHDVTAALTDVEVLRIGDGAAPRDVTSAIYEGEKAGREV